MTTNENTPRFISIQPINGPWKAASHFEDDYYHHFIYNTETGQRKQIGIIGAARANYYEKALDEAERRNQKITGLFQWQVENLCTTTQEEIDWYKNWKAGNPTGKPGEALIGDQSGQESPAPTFEKLPGLEEALSQAANEILAEAQAQAESVIETQRRLLRELDEEEAQAAGQETPLQRLIFIADSMAALLNSQGYPAYYHTLQAIKKDIEL